MIKSYRFLILGIALVAGCALPPATHMPQPRAAPDLGIVADPTPLPKPGSWPSSEWWRQFALPELDRIEAHALRRNPSLAIAASRVRAAEALVDARAAASRPRLGAEAATDTVRFSEHGTHGPLNGRSLTIGILHPLALRWHLDLWQRDAAALAAAGAEQQAQAAASAEARLLVSAALARTYFALAATEMQLAEAKALQRNAEARLALAKTRFGAGLGTDQAVQQQSEQVAAHETTVIALQDLATVLRHALAALAGEGPAWGASITVPARLPLPALGLPADLPLDWVAHRPDVTVARWRVEARSQGIRAARAAFYPDINLRAFTGWESISLADLVNPANAVYALGPAVHLPLFEGGRLRADLRAREAEYAMAVAAYDDAVLGAAQDVADALTRWQSAGESLAVQQRALAAAKRTLSLESGRAAAGLVPRDAVLAADDAARQAQLRQITMTTAQLDAAADLLTALGGGFTDPQLESHRDRSQ